jgi:hypothetical protein
MEMVKIIIRNACLFQPFRTRSDRVDTLTVQNGGHQYETRCLWDEFSKSRSPSWTTKICKRVHTNVLRLCRGRRRLATSLTKHGRWCTLGHAGIGWTR